MTPELNPPRATQTQSRFSHVRANRLFYLAFSFKAFYSHLHMISDVTATKDVGQWKINHNYYKCSAFPVIFYIYIFLPILLFPPFILYFVCVVPLFLILQNLLLYLTLGILICLLYLDELQATCPCCALNTTILSNLKIRYILIQFSMFISKKNKNLEKSYGSTFPSPAVSKQYF